MNYEVLVLVTVSIMCYFLCPMFTYSPQLFILKQTSFCDLPLGRETKFHSTAVRLKFEHTRYSLNRTLAALQNFEFRVLTRLSYKKLFSRNA
jgi:hypothetical protein